MASTTTAPEDVEVPETEEDEVQPDLEVIVPDLGPLFVNGVECKVKRIKLVQLLALLRMLTTAMGGRWLKTDMDSDPEVAAQQLAGVLLMAVPLAPAEFTMFLCSVVDPVQSGKRGQVVNYLQSGECDIEEVAGILEIVATQELDDLGELLGKLKAMFARLTKQFRTSRGT